MVRYQSYTDANKSELWFTMGIIVMAGLGSSLVIAGFLLLV